MRTRTGDFAHPIRQIEVTMATACIPIRELREAGRKGAALSAKPRRVLNRLRAVWLFPKLLRYINHELSGERLGSLDVQQARALYESLLPFHESLTAMIDRLPSKPFLERLLIGWWYRRIESENDRIGEMLETLAWGSDEELRGFINSAVEAIENKV